MNSKIGGVGILLLQKRMIAQIASFCLPGAIGLVGENYFARIAFPAFYAPSKLIPFLPCGYGGVLFVNVICSSLAMSVLGAQVGKARSIYKEKAKKDGDADAEERFSYPKLYAEGFSKHAKDFNCVQRGHQQALETYAQFIALSLISGITQPMLTTVGGALWIIARFTWAQGYATGEPSRRYDSFFSKWIWIALLIQLIGATRTVLTVCNFF